MSELLLTPSLVAMAETGKIGADDVSAMRNDIFSDGQVNRYEAEMLLALDLAVKHKCVEWREFFVEAIVDYIVYQADPEGIISDDNAEWLIHCISRDGLVDSAERLELLIKVLETAAEAPEYLMKFALEQVAQAVLHNQGPMSVTRIGETNVICQHDVEVIRRLMYAFGGDGGMAVTRMEAEFLFDLNDKTLEQVNHPAWTDLFMRAVGNHVLATLGDAAPKRTIALETEDWMKGDGLVNTIINSLRSTFSAFHAPYETVEHSISHLNEVNQVEQMRASDLTESEASWIGERINRDGLVHENEKALLNFLKNEATAIHPKLNKLLKIAA